MHTIDAHDGANSSMECRRSGAQLASLIHTYPSCSTISSKTFRRLVESSIDLLYLLHDGLLLLEIHVGPITILLRSQ